MIERAYFLVVCLCFSNSIFSEDGWILRKKAEGIVVYTKPVAGTEYSQFKASVRVKTSLFSILAVWADPAGYTNWMFNCKASSLLKQETPLALYAYIVSDVPWPLVSRDNILFADTMQDEATGKITIELTGKPDYIAKTPNMIRVVKSFGRVELIPQPGGEIEIIFNFFMNPGGLIPAPVINLTIIDFPFFTLKKMKEIVKQPKYQETDFPFLKNFL